MLILISPARNFCYNTPETPFVTPTLPKFQKEAEHIGRILLGYNSQQLAQMMKDSLSLGVKSQLYWEELLSGRAQLHPAVDYYTGMVYQKLDAASLLPLGRSYLADYLYIVSPAYGLVRSTDLIAPYRLLPTATIAELQGSVAAYWRPILTDYLIEQAAQLGGEICYLGSSEMTQLFDWKKVCREVSVVAPTFQQIDKQGRLRQIVIYTKMARGLMLRALAESGISSVGQIEQYAPSGYITTYDRG